MWFLLPLAKLSARLECWRQCHGTQPQVSGVEEQVLGSLLLHTYWSMIAPLDQIRVLQWESSATQYGFCFPPWVLALRAHPVVLRALSVLLPPSKCLSTGSGPAW